MCYTGIYRIRVTVSGSSSTSESSSMRELLSALIYAVKIRSPFCKLLNYNLDQRFSRYIKIQETRKCVCSVILKCKLR